MVTALYKKFKCGYAETIKVATIKIVPVTTFIGSKRSSTANAAPSHYDR